jgi:hypothetical protein
MTLRVCRLSIGKSLIVVRVQFSLALRVAFRGSLDSTLIEPFERQLPPMLSLFLPFSSELLRVHFLLFARHTPPRLWRTTSTNDKA